MNISTAFGYGNYNSGYNKNTTANNRNVNNPAVLANGTNANPSANAGDASNVLDNVINPNGKNSTPDKSADNQTNNNKNGLTQNQRKIQDSSKECQTCENRRYQDGSNDASVSFQSPTKISPENVASAVRGHEQQHVSHEQYKAQRDQRKIISQTVALHTGICPECGKTYISGGTTRTVSKSDSQAARYDVGKNNDGGSGFSATA